MRSIALASVLLASLSTTACAPREPRVVGMQAGHFVSDAAIENVKVCATRSDDLLAAFGPPTSRGRDNDFTTFQWVGMVTASDGTRAAMRSQMIHVWVDRSGRVAGIVVNPGSMPTTPKSCPTGGAPTAAAGKAEPTSASKAKLR